MPLAINGELAANVYEKRIDLFGIHRRSDSTVRVRKRDLKMVTRVAKLATIGEPTDEVHGHRRCPSGGDG